MQFLVLGPVEIAAGDRRVTIASSRQRVILAVLLAEHGRVVSADRLIDALWGEAPPSSASKSLHSHVSRLRRVLADAAPDGESVILTEPDGYRVDLGRHELDADRFEMLVARGRQHLHADADVSARLLDEALGLWRGEAFGELADREPLRFEALRLDALRTAAVADQVDARLAAGAHVEVIADLEAAVAADPLAERPHAQLMLALYRSGRQADALAAYWQLRERLVEEIGVDPAPDVQELQARILRQDADLVPPPAPASKADPAPPDRAVGGSLPPPARLLGRGEDVAAVTGMVTTARLVTLTGPGGVGKSRLAEAVAAAAGEQFEDGVVWCPLSGVRDAGSVSAALLAALRVPHQDDRPPGDVLLAALGTRRLLLLLDNCEHLLDAVTDIVAAIGIRCPNTAVLATSREHLHLSGERVWEVNPLPVPRSGATAAEVAATPAGVLFRARAHEVDPSFELTDANASTIAALCRTLDGIPLAIELAAARVRSLALDELAARIDHRFELLTGGSRLEGGRHRTLHAMVEWSYRLLTDPQRRVFDRLSVFAGPFPLAAAEQVCAGEPLQAREVAGLLAELGDKSLVAVDRSSGGSGAMRYRLLDTLRAYGAERLEESGQAGPTHDRHAAHHVRLAEELAAQARGPDERGALEALDAALDDFRVAHAWLIFSGDADGALRLPSALHDDLHFRPRDEVFTWVERALDVPGAPEQAAYAAALATAARGAMNHNELGRARELAETALSEAGPSDLATLWALYVLTTVALYEGRLEDALGLADRRVALARSLGQDYHGALAGVSRVLAEMYREDSDAAMRAAAEAREAAEASGNHTARAWALYASGEAALEADPVEAARLLEQAVDAARGVERPFIAGVALVSLASLCGRRGEAARALHLFREAVAHWRPLGADAQQLTTLRNLVELLVRVGADEPAAVLHGAVTAAEPASFGAEADRLAAAWELLERRLGSQAAAAAADRGRRLREAEVVDAALATLDDLLGATVPTAGRAP